MILCKKAIALALILITFGNSAEVYNETKIREYSVSLSDANTMTSNPFLLKDGIISSDYKLTYFYEGKEIKNVLNLIQNGDTFLYRKDLAKNRIKTHNDILEILKQNIKNEKNIDYNKIVFLINLLKIDENNNGENKWKKR